MTGSLVVVGATAVVVLPEDADSDLAAELTRAAHAADSLGAIVAALSAHIRRLPALACAIREGAELRLLLRGTASANVYDPAGGRSLSAPTVSSWSEHLLGPDAAVVLRLEDGGASVALPSGTELPPLTTPEVSLVLEDPAGSAVSTEPASLVEPLTGSVPFAEADTFKLEVLPVVTPEPAPSPAPTGNPPRLVFSDGGMVEVDGHLIIGRQPIAPHFPDGTGTPPRAVTMPHADQRLSRLHAEIRVEGGYSYVVDSGSTNGTTVTAPGGEARRLRQGEPCLLTEGTEVDLGGAVSFVFHA